MTKRTDQAREMANRLNSQYAELGSWRKVAAAYYPGVTFQTLNRIALSGGEWIPKDRAILQALGLIKARKPEPEHTRRIKRKIAKMARNLKNPEQYEDPGIPDAEKRMRRKP